MISPKTARNHIEHIYVKTGATSRVAASVFAMKHGLLTDAPPSRALSSRQMGQLPHDSRPVEGVVQWATVGLRDKLFALSYDRLMASTESAGLAEIRARLLADATGDVLEVGAGTGAQPSAYYGSAVRTLTLTEPDPSMLRRLQRSASDAGRSSTVLRAPAEDLPFDDGTFDTVVCTLVLCGVDDQPRAVREIRRVLRPGGCLLFVEHVRSDDEALARRQDRMNWFEPPLRGLRLQPPDPADACSAAGSPSSTSSPASSRSRRASCGR